MIYNRQIYIIVLIFSFNILLSQDKNKEFNFGLGLGVSTITGDEGVNVTTPIIKLVLPVTNRIQFSTDYVKFFNMFNTSKTLHGSTFRLSSQMILVDIEVLQLYTTVGYNYVGYLPYEGINRTNLSGATWSIGFKSKINKQHVYYEERTTYNSPFNSDNYSKARNVSMGTYRDVTIKFKKKDKTKIKKNKNDKIDPYKIKMQTCPFVE